MIAVIKTGGKQYKIKEKDAVKIEKLDSNVGDKVEFGEVLLVAEEDGGNLQVGQPLLEGIKVVGKVLEQGRNRKVTIIKYKPKTRYRKKAGHRQFYTKVEITKISA